MTKFFKRFGKDECGAVTVDWVVLTAALVALAVVAFDTIGTNADTLIGNAATAVGTDTNTFTGGGS
jgi:Flp pilus assembly pilin Flp